MLFKLNVKDSQSARLKEIGHSVRMVVMCESELRRFERRDARCDVARQSKLVDVVVVENGRHAWRNDHYDCIASCDKTRHHNVVVVVVVVVVKNKQRGKAERLVSSRPYVVAVSGVTRGANRPVTHPGGDTPPKIIFVAEFWKNTG